MAAGPPACLLQTCHGATGPTIHSQLLYYRDIPSSPTLACQRAHLLSPNCRTGARLAASLSLLLITCVRKAPASALSTSSRYVRWISTSPLPLMKYRAPMGSKQPPRYAGKASAEGAAAASAARPAASVGRAGVGCRHLNSCHRLQGQHSGNSSIVRSARETLAAVRAPGEAGCDVLASISPSQAPGAPGE